MALNLFIADTPAKRANYVWWCHFSTFPVYVPGAADLLPLSPGALGRGVRDIKLFVSATRATVTIVLESIPKTMHFCLSLPFLLAGVLSVFLWHTSLREAHYYSARLSVPLGSSPLRDSEIEFQNRSSPTRERDDY